MKSHVHKASRTPCKLIRLLAARCSSRVQGLGHGARLVHGTDEHALREGCLAEQVRNGVVALCIPAATCRRVSARQRVLAADKLL